MLDERFKRNQSLFNTVIQDGGSGESRREFNRVVNSLCQAGTVNSLLLFLRMQFRAHLK